MTGRPRPGNAPSTGPPPRALERQPSVRLSASATEEQVRGRLERLAALGAKTSVVAHELRNSLSVLETSLHIVRRALKNAEVSDKVQTHLGRMADQIHAGQAIVREVLEEGRDAIERQEVDLRTMVMEVVQGVPRPESVSAEILVPACRVAVDGRQIRQLLLNLVRNAVEAVLAREGEGREGRVVRVIGSITSDALHLAVEDNGPGIDATIVPRLFQAFASSKSGGTGLGLVVCRRIAQAHGGDIVARNIEPHGTSFEVTLPLGPVRPRS